MKRVTILRRRRNPDEVTTARIAIRNHCLECVGYVVSEVERCTSPECWLYPWRMDDKFRRGEYSVESGEVAFREIVPGPRDGDALSDRNTFWGRGNSQWASTWVRVPGPQVGEYAVGPLSYRYPHRVVMTAHAFWIVSRGELVRLDRARLTPWFGE